MYIPPRQVQQAQLQSLKHTTNAASKAATVAQVGAGAEMGTGQQVVYMQAAANLMQATGYILQQVK